MNDHDHPRPVEERSVLLTTCARLVGSIGILILVVLLPATFLVAMASLGLTDALTGWGSRDSVVLSFALVVVPVGLALAAAHFILAALMLGRRSLPVVVVALGILATATLLPVALRIAWPLVSLTILYVASFLLTLAHHDEFG